MPKHKTIKEIHQFLINNNLFHRDENYLIKKKLILSEESDEQDPSSLYEKPEILTDRGELY